MGCRQQRDMEGCARAWLFIIVAFFLRSGGRRVALLEWGLARPCSAAQAGGSSWRGMGKGGQAAREG